MARHELIAGVHAVSEALAADEPLIKIIVGEKREHDARVREIVRRARAANVPVSVEGSTRHRGVLRW